MGACDQYIEPDIIQAPGESIIYKVDWPSRGLPSGVTIASQSFSPSGTTDYTLSNKNIVDNGLQTQFQLTGGIPGNSYQITNDVVLSDGETMQATLIYDCVAVNTRQRNTCL